MADDGSASPLEDAFRLARSGDTEAFARWMGKVEMPLRKSLHRFARAVDVEVVVQETLLRMWLVAWDPGRPLAGPDASLKFAFRVARNVALEEVRRNMDEAQSASLTQAGCTKPPRLPGASLGAAVSPCGCMQAAAYGTGTRR